MRLVPSVVFAAAAVLILGCATSTQQGRSEKILDVERIVARPMVRGADVLVRPFVTEGADLGTGSEGGKEGRVEAAEKIKASGPGLLAASISLKLRESKLFGTVSIAGNEASAQPPATGVLIVEGKFLAINPGSRAKRYWVGFGAGRSGVVVSGRVIDGTGKVIAEFEHGRHSGIGFYGGSYVKFLTDDVEDIGSDIGEFLVALISGGPKR